MTRYRERLHEGFYEATEPEADPPAPAPLPRTHAELDELADERGHGWSSDSLTVAEKQAELEAGA